MTPEVAADFQWIRANWYTLPEDMWLAVKNRHVIYFAKSADDLKKSLERVTDAIIVVRHDGKPFDQTPR